MEVGFSHFGPVPNIGKGIDAALTRLGLTLRADANIVVLTGAGISAESGVATFRGAGGLWEGHAVEEVATPEGFEANPSLVHRFYSERRMQLPNVAPNAAHRALARLEAVWRGDVHIVTQNVDDLHERAGSKAVIHMHGELNKMRCTLCGVVVRCLEETTVDTPCPNCAANDCMRPDIVWFGEMQYQMDRIELLLGQADVFVSIGTSGLVYPAAGFVAHVRALGRAKTIEINLDDSAKSGLFDYSLRGAAGVYVPLLVDKFINPEP